MAEAPFLCRIRRGELHGESVADALVEPASASSGTEADPPQGSAAGELGLDADDFPSWYQDNLDEADNTGEDGNDEAPNDGWLDELAAVRTLDKIDFDAVTVFAGDNGTGKSTVLEAIAVAAGFNPEGGSRNLQFSTWDTHSPLGDELVLEWRSRPRWGWFLRAETFYGMASHIAADDDPETGLSAIFPELHRVSHGESFMALAESRFTGAGLYLFDEPESALSIQGQRRLLAIMRGTLDRGAQFIIATHSPIFMALPGSAIYEFDANSGVQRTEFEDLASTREWRSFWSNPASWHTNGV